VIFVSSYDLQVAKKYNLLQNGARKSLIRCGISLSRIPRAAPSDSRHVGFIGRLENQKDPLLVLEVFARLPDYALTLVGGGQLEPQVRERINLRGLKVQMLGSLSHDRTLDVLSTLGVLVMTSRWEGLPIIALEAMGAGVPVVATRVGGLSEIIEDGRSGLLVRSRSPEDIAAAVRRLTGDEDLRASIIKNARDRVEALFSEARMLAKLQKVYDEVARR
jgi:glycosyltransferase involved in cell wall biosynthesis